MHGLDIERVCLETVFLLLQIFVIYICYLLARAMVQGSRKDKWQPANIFEKIRSYFIGTGVFAFIWFVLPSNGYEVGKLQHGYVIIAIIIVTYFSVILGIAEAYSIDSKLTEEEHIKLNREIEKDSKPRSDGSKS